MNLENILGEIEKTDPEIYDRLDTRRHAMKQFTRIGGKIALASIPLALGSMFNKAYSQPGNSVVLDVLNYALTLEYLEAEFYTKAVAAKAAIGIPDGAPIGAITTIMNHENQHVAFLRTAITAVGGAGAIKAKPNFDFTAKGTFGNVFSNYTTFLAVAQVFEDTGVRAYKGRAAEIVKGGDYLTAALNIHSVEARHAAHIRLMRKTTGQAPNLKPWITGKDSGIGLAAVQASYDGEELTTQAGANIINIGGASISANAASEAFDEPLTAAQVLTIVTPFIVP